MHINIHVEVVYISHWKNRPKFN